MNTIRYFEIQSSDPPREVNFYQNVFGWTFTLDKNVPIEFYHIHTNGIEGGLLKRPADVPGEGCGTNSFTNLIMVANYDQTAEKVLAHGGKVAMAKFAIPGQRWQGYFLDPDQNVFGIFEIDEEAI